MTSARKVIAGTESLLCVPSGSFLLGGKGIPKAVFRDKRQEMGLPRAGVHGDRIWTKEAGTKVSQLNGEGGGVQREKREKRRERRTEAGHLESRAAVGMPGSDSHPFCQTRLITHRVQRQ